jgi:Fe-Mn family superoxide dismutase
MSKPAAISSSGGQAIYRPVEYKFAHVEGLSRKALDLHLELYKGYVKQLNAVEGRIADLATKEKLGDAERLQKEALMHRHAFEFNGMLLHELFFEQLDGDPAGAAPMLGSPLAEAIDTSFPGLDAWRNDIFRLAETRGIGWVICVQRADDKRLSNFWVSEHQVGMPATPRPIVVFDLWEHAYLLDFSPSARLNYVATLFRNLDWSVLDRRCVRQREDREKA